MQPGAGSVRWFCALLSLLSGTVIIFQVPEPEPWLLFVMIPLSGTAVLPLGRFLYALMALLTRPAGVVTAFCVLGAVYYVVVTPVGIFRKSSWPEGWQQSTPGTDGEHMYE